MGLKILVIYTGAYPIGRVTTHRVHNLCRGLVENGATLRLLLARATENPADIRNETSTGVYQGVSYQGIGRTNIRSRRFLRRRMDDFVASLRTILYVGLNRSKSDLVLIIGPSFDFRLLIPVVVKFTRARVLLEINEYPFVNKPNTWTTRLKRSILVRLFFPLYDGFVCISEELRTLLARHKRRKARIIKVPILANDETPPPPSEGPLSQPYLLHAGSLAEAKDGIQGILQAFAIARKQLAEPLKLVITGNVTASRHYRATCNIIEQLELQDAVLFPGFLSREELRQYFEHSTLTIINKLDTLQNRYCFPTKLADYLSHGIAVITTSVGELHRHLQADRSAYVVPPGSPQLLAQAVVRALKNPGERSRIAEAGREVCARDFNYLHQGKRLLDFCKQVCPQNLETSPKEESACDS